MSLNKYTDYTKKCFRNDPAPCVCECIFHLDISAFFEKVKRGRWNSAYRLYRDKVVFPGIVSQLCPAPCKDACVYANREGAVLIDEIERFCVSRVKKREAPRFNERKEKKAKVNVVGGGISGIACALKLALRNYAVDLYESGDQIGGSLNRRLGKDKVNEEIYNEIGSLSINIILNSTIDDLEALEGDAIYIATGKDGEDFGLKDGTDTVSLNTAKQGVFMGGELIIGGENKQIFAIEHGVRAAQEIDAYIKTGKMHSLDAGRKIFQINKDYYRRTISETAPVRCESGESVSREIGRCDGCRCSDCIDVCPMMRYFRKDPIVLTKDVTSSLNAVDNFTKRYANQIINSCNHCGLCSEVCIEQVDMGECMLVAKQELTETGVIPPAYHDYFLRDLDFAMSDDAFFSYIPVNCKYVFFPGCQLGGSDPDYVIKTYDKLQELSDSVGIMIGCCGIPAKWAGDRKTEQEVILEISRLLEAGKTLIAACPMCKEQLSAELDPEQISVISLYQFLDSKMSSFDPSLSNERSVHVFDACVSRNDTETKEAIRSLLKKGGFSINELGKNMLQCCGVGGHIYGANPELFKEAVQEKVSTFTDPVVAYCSNCRDTLSYQSNECFHILDVILDINKAFRKAPNITEKRENRKKLKRCYDELLYGRRAVPQTDDIDLIISDELLLKMDAKLLLRDDVIDTICYCEQTGLRLWDDQKKVYIGHKKTGYITIWVEYSFEKDTYVLQNVYSHRLSIEGEIR